MSESKQKRITSEAARELSKKGSKKGGKARASVLSPAERSEIARRAVEARWAKAGKLRPQAEDDEPADTPKAAPEIPFSMFQGTLDMGNVTMQCHVLNDGRRVLTQTEVVRAATGGSETGNLKLYLRRHPTLDENVFEGRTIRFQIPASGLAIGYEATLLIELCDSYLDAREKGVLKKGQAKLAKQAEVVMRATAKVGIIALIDEATGYQKVRESRALQVKLQAFIADDMQEWAKTFPDEFWFELARLEGVRYSPRNRPLRWGKYVMAFVYDAMDEDVGKTLREKNPNPHFRQNHHQWLKKFGKDQLHDQIMQVIAVMKTCDDIDEFKRRFQKVFGKSYQTELPGDWDF